MENATKKTEPTLHKQKIISLVRGLIDDEQRDAITDRRREHRHRLSVPVIARPIGRPPNGRWFCGRDARHLNQGRFVLSHRAGQRGVFESSIS